MQHFCLQSKIGQIFLTNVFLGGAHWQVRTHLTQGRVFVVMLPKGCGAQQDHTFCTPIVGRYLTSRPY